MEAAIEKNQLQIKNKKNSLECTCEKLMKNGKNCIICDVCSEKTFLRNASNTKFDDGKISCL